MLDKGKALSDDLKKQGKSDHEVAEALVKFVNSDVFKNDTSYDLKTGASHPTFEKIMRSEVPETKGKNFVPIEALMAAGHADCRGRNMVLAALMNQAGIKDAKMTNTKAATNGEEENHTVVTYTDSSGTARVADAYFRQFNAPMADLKAGRTTAGGRHTQSDAGQVTAKINAIQGWPLLTTVAPKGRTSGLELH
jgi:hypothetical protein